MRLWVIRLMHVLVTGGTGFVGSHTVRALLDQGHRVRVLARSRAKAERVFAGSALPVTVTGDATDPTAVGEALEGVDAVVHCAALVATDARRAKEIHDTNVRLVEVVVGGAVERGIGTIVYISSVLALFAPGSPIDEHSALTAARSPYAAVEGRQRGIHQDASGPRGANLHALSSRHHRS